MSARARSTWVVLVLLALPVGADEPARLELDTSKVTGNRELPRVMAIVPWKKAPPGELPGRPLQSLLDEALTPADRLVMRRQVDQWTAVEAARQTEFSVPPGARRAAFHEEE
jgi:hypothetical protein